LIPGFVHFRHGRELKAIAHAVLPVLCKACDNSLNENGERHFDQVFRNWKTAPQFELLPHNEGRHLMYSNVVGDVWRGLLCEPATSRQFAGIEAMRRYLLNPVSSAIPSLGAHV
jgi:hypothetical protein